MQEAATRNNRPRQLDVACGQGEEGVEEVEDVDPVEQVEVLHLAVAGAEGHVKDHELQVYVDNHKRLLVWAVVRGRHHYHHCNQKHQES